MRSYGTSDARLPFTPDPLGATEIGLLESRIAREIDSRTRHFHGAAVDQVGAVGKGEGVAGHLVHDKERHAFLPERGKGAEKLLDHEGGEAERRLVEASAGAAR